MEIEWQEVLSAIDRVLEASFTIGGSRVTVADLMVVVAILVVTWIISRLMRRGLERIMRRRGVGDPGSVALTLRITHYTIMMLGLLTGIAQVGINLSALFAAGAVFAVGIGFALQGLTANFVSGVILLFERSIKPGDIVEVDGHVVRVLRLGSRTTLCRNRDDEEILIPNSHLADGSVKNFTLHDTLLRIRASVGVAYESDMKQVMEVLQEMAAELPWRHQDRKPVVFLTTFGASSVDFEVSVWIDDPWQAPKGRSDLMRGIWFALQEAGITIAFPQIDVHFDAPADRADDESVPDLPKAS